jgi:hypothetical protein
LPMKTQGAPTDATKTPPSSGPRVRPAYRPIEIRLFAHDRFSAPATLGIAAPDAAGKGASNTEAMKARASRMTGRSVRNAITSQQTAAADSPTIITRRRSKRSPIAPLIGPSSPMTPHVRIIAAATQAAEPVSA